MKSNYSIRGSGQLGTSVCQRAIYRKQSTVEGFQGTSLSWKGRIGSRNAQSNINLTSSAFHNPARPDTAIKLSALDTVWLLNAPMVASAASAASSSTALNPNTQSFAQIDVLDLLLHNPALAALVAFLALVVVPRVIMASIRIIALPAGVFLVLYVAATHPSETQAIVVSVYSWTSAHPVLTSGGILVLATLLLLPSFLLAAGSAAVILALSQIVAMDLPNVFGGNDNQEVSASNQGNAQNVTAKPGDTSNANRGNAPVLAQTTPLPVPPLPAVKLPFGLSSEDVEKLSERLLQQAPRNNTTVTVPLVPKTTAPIKPDAAESKSEAAGVVELEDDQKKPNRFIQFLKRFKSGVQQADPIDSTTSQAAVVQVQVEKDRNETLAVAEPEPEQKKPRKFSLFGKKSKADVVTEAGLEDSKPTSGLVLQQEKEGSNVLIEDMSSLRSSLIEDRSSGELRPETFQSTNLSQPQQEVDENSRMEQKLDARVLDSRQDDVESVAKGKRDRLLEILERS